MNVASPLLWRVQMLAIYIGVCGVTVELPTCLRHVNINRSSKNNVDKLHNKLGQPQLAIVEVG